jgi:hypothetical protein
MDANGDYRREETSGARLDRNFGDLLQELRVAETGVQILFAFLLSIAFQQRFATISDVQADIYLASLVSSSLAAVLFIAPVALHRFVFRQHQKDDLVRVTAKLAGLGLVFLALAMLGAVVLIVDVVAGPTAATVLGSVSGLCFVGFWLVLPWSRRGRDRP